MGSLHSTSAVPTDAATSCNTAQQGCHDEAAGTSLPPCLKGFHCGLWYVQVVLGTKRAREVTQEILETHCIASDRSPDLQQANGSAAAAAGANGNAKAGPSGAAAQQQQEDVDEEPAEEAGKGAAAAGSKRGRR